MAGNTRYTRNATEALESLLAAIEGTALAQTLRTSRWFYAGVNGTHIFAVALLVGAIVPLNLRLLGAWRGIPRETVVRLLAPVAACGLVLALITGPLLFSVRAREYSGVGFLHLKLVFIAVGVMSTLALCRSHGFLVRDAPRARLAAHAVISIVCWPGALVCGRLIAFAAD